MLNVDWKHFRIHFDHYLQGAKEADAIQVVLPGGLLLQGQSSTAATSRLLAADMSRSTSCPSNSQRTSRAGNGSKHKRRIGGAEPAQSETPQAEKLLQAIRNSSTIPNSLRAVDRAEGFTLGVETFGVRRADTIEGLYAAFDDVTQARLTQPHYRRGYPGRRGGRIGRAIRGAGGIVGQDLRLSAVGPPRRRCTVGTGALAT